MLQPCLHSPGGQLGPQECCRSGGAGGSGTKREWDAGPIPHPAWTFSPLEGSRGAGAIQWVERSVGPAGASLTQRPPLGHVPQCCPREPGKQGQQHSPLQASALRSPQDSLVGVLVPTHLLPQQQVSGPCPTVRPTASPRRPHLCPHPELLTQSWRSRSDSSWPLRPQPLPWMPGTPSTIRPPLPVPGVAPPGAHLPPKGDPVWQARHLAQAGVGVQGLLGPPASLTWASVSWLQWGWQEPAATWGSLSARARLPPSQ